jgi:hypothetical protein
MTLTAELMAEIAGRRMLVIAINDRCQEEARAFVVASRDGVANQKARKAHADLMRSRAALKCAIINLDYSRERLARACEPWFWLP